MRIRFQKLYGKLYFQNVLEDYFLTWHNLNHIESYMCPNPIRDWLVDTDMVNAISRLFAPLFFSHLFLSLSLLPFIV